MYINQLRRAKPPSGHVPIDLPVRGRLTAHEATSETVTDDSRLVREMLAGEERAFTAFFETYFPRIYRFALPRLGRNEDVAKDVVQATLIKAMRKLGDYRGEAAMFTWLCQICRREIADHVRTQRRHSEKVVLIEDSDDVRAALESIEGPPAQSLWGSARVEVRRGAERRGDRRPVGNRPHRSAVAARASSRGIPGRARGRVRCVGRRRARRTRGLRGTNERRHTIRPG